VQNVICGACGAGDGAGSGAGGGAGGGVGVSIIKYILLYSILYMLRFNPAPAEWLEPYIENNHHRLDELNHRLNKRVYPDFEIAQSISPRPVETKYTILGKSNDPRVALPVEPIKGYSQNSASINHNFICGDVGEPTWFLKNIDTETILRNQTFALQSGGVAPQATFIPSSKSELYGVKLPHNTNVVEQPFPFLFEHTRFDANRRAPQKGNVDTRNKYIAETFQKSMYKDGRRIGVLQSNDKPFNNLARASLLSAQWQ